MSAWLRQPIAAGGTMGVQRRNKPEGLDWGCLSCTCRPPKSEYRYGEITIVFCSSDQRARGRWIVVTVFRKTSVRAPLRHNRLSYAQRLFSLRACRLVGGARSSFGSTAVHELYLDTPTSARADTYFGCRVSPLKRRCRFSTALSHSNALKKDCRPPAQRHLQNGARFRYLQLDFRQIGQR